MKVLKTVFKILIVLLLAVIIFILGFFSFHTFRANDYENVPASADSQDKIKVILDCDNSLGSYWEVDDGLVLSYLLNKPEAELLGVTTTFGNRTYDHKYTERMLKKAGRTNLPLYKGEQTSNEGITEAAHFLAEAAAEFPGEISIIAAGPVGNLEAAAQIDPDFYKNVGQITVMGGYTENLDLGNRDVPELNLSADYEASFKLITSEARVTIMTGQACLDAPFRFSDFPKLSNFPNYWKFQSVFWTVLNRLGTGNNYFILWDLLPTIYVFHPEYFDDNPIYINSSVEDLSKGMLRISDSKDGHIINIPEGITDKEAFYEDFFTQLNRQGK